MKNVICTPLRETSYLESDCHLSTLFMAFVFYLRLNIIIYDRRLYLIDCYTKLLLVNLNFVLFGHI